MFMGCNAISRFVLVIQRSKETRSKSKNVPSIETTFDKAVLKLNPAKAAVAGPGKEVINRNDSVQGNNGN